MRLETEINVTGMPPTRCGMLDEVPTPDVSSFEKALNEGIAAAQNGQREAARESLAEAAELNAFSEDAWMWLASISEYPEETVAFLTNVLTINPANARAKKWLAETEALVGMTGENHMQEIFEINEIPKDGAVYARTKPSVSGPPNRAICPFCSVANESSAFECRSCRAGLTLSDIESILSNTNANREAIQVAVTNMEAEWNLRDFDGTELTMLGIGYLNLRSYDEGLKYLNEALLLDPNNVILSGQINSLAIRLDEMRRQNEVHDAMVKGKNVLVVDDSATVRKLISSKLEKAGHNVTCAVDGVEALAMIAESLPDIMFLDISMPRMDGYEVCKQIRSNPAAKHLPIVMISGKDGFFDKVRGRMAGTTDYITKPFGPDALMRAMETYLIAGNDAGLDQ
jgi:twitching motility two-component system response regulator PilG